MAGPETDAGAADGDRAEHAAAAVGIAEGMPSPVPENALGTADPADLADQLAAVPLDEDDYR